MTCEWDFQAICDCSYHMCEFFPFLHSSLNGLFFTFTREEIVQEPNGGGLMGTGRVSWPWMLRKGLLKALKKDFHWFSLFGLLSDLLPQRVFFFRSIAAERRDIFNVRWKNQAKRFGFEMMVQHHLKKLKKTWLKNLYFVQKFT